jgi:hypothetical protein
MNTRYVFIDHENVQPKDLALLDGQPFRVVVFLGANQARLSTELAVALQARGADGAYVRINGRTGPTADIGEAALRSQVRPPQTPAHQSPCLW